MKETRNTLRIGKRSGHWLWLLPAAVVALCTVWALMRPGITLETVCGLPEHTHTDACYTQLTVREKKLPACQVEADIVIHKHDSVCYDENGKLWCTLPEAEAHQHTDSCYAVHTHGDACYTPERGELICTESTEPLHIHSEDCYTAAATLVCGLSESAGHIHGAECWDGEGNLICGQEESEGHTHGEGCYETTRELICGQSEEHQHTDECYNWGQTLTCSQSEEPVLVCEKEEILPHTHQPYDSEDSPGCYDAEGNLICGMAEVIEHQHTDACFETVTEPVDTETLTCTSTDPEHEHTPRCYGTWELTCGMEEHTHSEECGGKKETSVPEEIEPVLTGDNALVTALEVTAQNREQNGLPWLVRSGGTAVYQLELKAQTDDGTAFPAGRVKLELVLPLTAQEGAFDLDAMPWLEESAVTEETRTMGEEALSCQVLTGYLLLNPEEEVPTVEAAQNAVIKLLTVEPGKEVTMQVSAAMEHSTWEGICPTHQAAERLTVTAEPFTTACTLEEAEENYANFLALLEGQEAIDESLLAQLTEAYRTGQLTEEAYTELYERAFILIYGSPDTIAEQAVGTNWMALRDSGWFEAYSACAYASRRAAPSRVMSLRSAAPYAAASQAFPSDVQIKSSGGSRTSGDGAVTVSKTIRGTELENVFDITLDVRTRENIAEYVVEPDMAVVIVLDISNTMNSNFGGTTRYNAAMNAAESFLDQFAANNSLGISKVGFVAFNTDAHQMFGLQSCSTQEQANALKNTMRSRTGAIINAAGYNASHSRFTNIEAGLAMASDMLNGVSNRNKFIIFLSDGFPTTYISSGYNGYDPYDDSGLFYDHVLKKPCSYGTSYSNEAAIRARNKAADIKGSGTTIFSIGVDVAGQTIQKYITQSEQAKGYSVVDRINTNYDIGDASSTEAYKSWLRDKIGSGYYYDSTDSAGLTSAFNDIFVKIKHKTMEASVADWVASDPMPLLSATEYVEFLGFYDKDSQFVGRSPLTGQQGNGMENTARLLSPENESQRIQWDLKNSGYQEFTQSTSGGTQTTYAYQLRYRVRLKNEIQGFGEETVYNTNDTTTLSYRTLTGTDDNLQFSQQQFVEFPIPSVHGYLADLTFNKIDSKGSPLTGAEFTLCHDVRNCGICRGDGTAVAVADMTAVSGGDGKVIFTGIPSGHRYTLTETKVPDGYSSDGNTYQVQVAYDKLTVTVTGPNGEEALWGGRIINNIYYELPATGGCGSGGFTLSGAGLLCLATAAMAVWKRKRVK